MYSTRFITYIILLGYFSSCAWDSDKGWHLDPESEEIQSSSSNKKDSYYHCADSNNYGKFASGGGCNVFGCWTEGGSCNEFGCSFGGVCKYGGCPKATGSFECLE